MIYRVAIRSTILLAGMGFTIPAYAAAEKAGVLKGTCSSGILTSHPVNYGTLSESDGVQTDLALRIRIPYWVIVRSRRGCGKVGKRILLSCFSIACVRCCRLVSLRLLGLFDATAVQTGWG
jgi:hypothetical protein